MELTENDSPHMYTSIFKNGNLKKYIYPHNTTVNSQQSTRPPGARVTFSDIGAYFFQQQCLSQPRAQIHAQPEAATTRGIKYNKHATKKEIT